MSTPARQILVVEDDQDLAGAVQALLTAEGYACDVVHDGEQGIDRGAHGTFDAIILDVMLPRRNGFAVASELRSRGVTSPIMMLTAKDGELDEVEGFESGADDFLRKPFERSILLARVNALIRRHDRLREPLLEVGALTINVPARVLSISGEALACTPREFEMMKFFMERPGVTFTRSEMLDALWGSDFDGDPNIVEVYVGYLRKKLASAGLTSVIETVRSAGYRLKVQS
jgi:DNA-binding response OmpR family regulator